MLFMDSLNIAKQGTGDIRFHCFAVTIKLEVFVIFNDISFKIAAGLRIQMVLVSLGFVVPDHFHVVFKQFI